MEIWLKWVHMARYGLVLRLDGALWLTIVFKPLLTPKGAIKDSKKLQKSLKVRAKPAKPSLNGLVILSSSQTSNISFQLHTAMSCEPGHFSSVKGTPILNWDKASTAKPRT